MIENERQLQAAQSWLQYWKDRVADGEQSWLGGENARAEVLHYRQAIAEYEKRRAEGQAKDEAGDGTNGDEASRVSPSFEQPAVAQHQ